MCFEGWYRKKTPADNNKTTKYDIFNVIAAALKSGITYNDLSNMSYVMLSNIVDAMTEGIQETDEERQKRLDAIT